MAATSTRPATCCSSATGSAPLSTVTTAVRTQIEHLIRALQADVDRAASPAATGRHLDGIGAIMESHFRFEERTLLGILDRLGLRAEVADVLGPL